MCTVTMSPRAITKPIQLVREQEDYRCIIVDMD